MGIYYNSLKTWFWHYTAGPKEKKHTKIESPVRKIHTSRQRIGNSEERNPVEGNDNNQTKRRELSRRKFIQRTKNTKPELRKGTTEIDRELRILQYSYGKKLNHNNNNNNNNNVNNKNHKIKDK